KSPAEVVTHFKNIMGMQLVTHQTGPEGKLVQKVFVEQGCNIKKEYYVAVLLDRATSQVSIMASSEGGMDIEEVAAHTPEKIHTLSIDPVTGLMPYQCRQLAFKIGLDPSLINKATKLFTGLYNAFVNEDAALLE